MDIQEITVPMTPTPEAPPKASLELAHDTPPASRARCTEVAYGGHEAGVDDGKLPTLPAIFIAACLLGLYVAREMIAEAIDRIHQAI